MSEQNYRLEAQPDHVEPARILVVDDSGFNRKKLKLAVEQLGYIAQTAQDGESALLVLAEQAFDAVLLDIMMPGIDGFGVLRRLKSDPTLKWVPIIVVSSLDDDTQSVVQAIELGAEDFLPNAFDPVILRARLSASLEKKRFRDQEIEYFERVKKLTSAAETVETGRVDPRHLKLDELAQFDDPLGQLAAVFRGMASEIYRRELRMAKTIHTLQGVMLVIVSGLIWGLNPALSRMASGLGANPIGLALWVNAIAAVCCLSIALSQGKLRRLTRREWGFFLGWALLTGVLQRLTMFTLAGYVEATILSLIVSLQGLLVFTFAATMGLERASPRRLVGLTAGLIGVVILLLTRFEPSDTAASIWVIAALALPTLLAIETIALACRRPSAVDSTAGAGIMLGMSVFMLAPMAYAMDDFMPLIIGPGMGMQEVVVLILGFVAAGSNVLYLRIVAISGPTFASQVGYADTLAGVVWGMLLLGERMPLIAWATFALVLLGMYLVEPKPSGNEVMVKRSFAKATA